MKIISLPPRIQRKAWFFNLTRNTRNPMRLAAIIVAGLCIQLLAGPNVVVIYFDDTGWTDFGCFGAAVDTPHIDGLARQGMRFTEYYAPAPNCSPSRAG